MTRKKVKLVWIVNDAARKASLKKRRIGLIKKVGELTTLCGVNAFAIIYSPDEEEPMVWPSVQVVQQMLLRYQNTPDMERCKKMMNQESYLKERMTKVQEQSKKNQKRNREIEMSYLMDKLHYHGNGIDDFELNDMQVLIWLLEERMKEIRKRVDYFQQVPPLPPGYFPASPQQGHNMNEMVHEGPSGDQTRNPPNAVSWDQWFIDMVNNSAAAGSSGTKNDMGFHAYNFAAGEVNMGSLALGPFPHGNFAVGSNSNSNSGVNTAAFETQLPPPSMSENPFGLGLSHGNITAASGNNVGNQDDSAGNEAGLPPGFLTGINDMGPPFDVSKAWPRHFPH